MGLGYLIYCARRWARKSQTDLARAMGTSRQNISRWERGDRAPSLWKLQWVADMAELDLVIGLRSRKVSRKTGEKEGEYIALGTYWHQPPLDYIELELDRYKDDPLRARLWRVRLGKAGGEDPSIR